MPRPSYLHDPSVSHMVLPNGLQVFFKPNAYPKKRLYMELVVRVGAIDESTDINGISHFIEHMAFKTTANFQNGQVFKELKEAGVAQGHHANAYTSLNRTVYHFHIPNETTLVGKALEFLREFGFYQAFLPEEVDLERKVIKEELRRAKDKDFDYYTGMISELFPDGSAYTTNTVLGTEASLDRITPEALRTFYQTHYVPGNMALILSGDSDWEELSSQITTLFGGLPTYPVPARSAVAPVTFKEPLTYIHTHKEYKEHYAGLVFPITNPIDDPKALRRRGYLYILLVWILKERFNNLLQHNPRITSMGITTDSNNFLPHSLIFLYVYSQGGSLKKGLRLLLQQVHYLETHGPSAEELGTVMQQAEEYIASSMKELNTLTNQHLAYDIQKGYMAGLPVIATKEDLIAFSELLTQITPEDISTLCTELLSVHHNPLCSFTLPPQHQIEATDITTLFEKERRMLPKEETYIATSTFEADLPPAVDPNTLTVTPLPEHDAVLYTCPNGLEVFVKHTDFESDTVYLSMATLGGQLFETPETIGLVEAYSYSLIRGGTKQHTYRDIQRILAPKKIHFAIDSWGSIGMTFDLTTAPHTFEEGLQLITSLFYRPQFREYDCKMGILEAIETIKQQEPSKAFAMEYHLSRLIYGNHPVGFTPRAKDIRKITLDQIKAFHPLAFPTTRTRVALVGNIRTLDVPHLLATTLGALPQTTSTLPAHSRKVSFPSTSIEKTIRKGAEEKALVRITFPGPTTQEARHLPFILYTEILNELLEDAIRETHGGTYAIGAINGASSFVDTGLLEVAFECDPARVTFLKAQVMQVLADAPTTITPLHVERARNPLLAWFEELQEENDLWTRVSKYRALDRDPFWLFAHIEKLRHTSLDAILAEAQLYSTNTLPHVHVTIVPYR